TKAFSVAAPALAIIGQRILRLADSRSGGGTQKTGRRDAFIHEKLEFLPAAQRPRAGRDTRKKNGAAFENADRVIKCSPLFFRSALLFRRGRIGQIRRLRRLLRLRCCSDGHHQSDEAKRGCAVPHSTILTRTEIAFLPVQGSGSGPVWILTLIVTI